MNLHIVDDNFKMNTGFYSFIKQDSRLLFGGYPSGYHFDYLKSIGVKYFIDLTTPYERKKLNVYNHNDEDIIYVNFPIKDNFIPFDMNLFNEFLIWLLFMISVLKENEMVYIHCKGGHGRSGMLMCCLLCKLYQISPEESIKQVTQSHHDRPLLSPKWKTRQCPSNEIQRMFVARVCAWENKEKNLNFQIEDSFNITRKRLLTYQQTKKILL